MMTYLSDFEQIQQEAIGLSLKKMQDIRRLDEDYVVNLCCALVAIARDRIAGYVEKYKFDRFSGRLQLVGGNRIFGKYTNTGSICLNPMLIFGSYRYFNYVILHELTHTVYFHHRIEFWQYLQHLMYSEGLVSKEMPFRLEEENKCLYLYHGERKVTDYWLNRYTKEAGFGKVSLLPDSEIPVMSMKQKAIFYRVFNGNKLSRYRRFDNSTYLVGANGQVIPMLPVWEQYIEKYHLASCLELKNWDYMSTLSFHNM